MAEPVEGGYRVALINSAGEIKNVTVRAAGIGAAREAGLAKGPAGFTRIHEVTKLADEVE